MNETAPKNWKVFLAHRDDVRIQDIDLFRDFAVSVEKGDALDHLRIYDFKTGAWKEIAYPEPVYSVFPGGTLAVSALSPLSNTAVTNVAITGGTGRFAHVRGQMTSTPTGNNTSTDVFHLNY